MNVAVQIGERASYSDVTRISSMLPGSPPLWLTRSGSEYFINGAQVFEVFKYSFNKTVLYVSTNNKVLHTTFTG